MYLLSVTAAQDKLNEVRSKERTDTHLTNKHTHKQMDHVRRQSYNIIYPIICLKSVDFRRLQVVILALSPREMSQTDRILPRYILSRVRVSVRPRIFYTRKKRKPQSPAYFTSIRAAEINNGIGSRRTEATRWCSGNASCC